MGGSGWWLDALETQIENFLLLWAVFGCVVAVDFAGLLCSEQSIAPLFIVSMFAGL